MSGDTDIRVLQTLLGHENINTTAMYTHPDFKAKQAALDGLMAVILPSKSRTVCRTTEAEHLDTTRNKR
ncbi:tyrosine-type recombinase/integrase [Oscillospiraceae bacterium OttesenSCG-928-G22]|nr:tyrosine-type recombinase/integrase [Oscillospiraceae bacterium OttesenSCG-928-G22]